MKVEIKHRYTNSVLFSCDVPDDVVSGLHMRNALEKATASGANLSGADLSRTDLSRADLSRADLSRSDLSGANLYGANLSRADLSRANLSGANLYGADLSGANLSRADLSGANLYGADLSGANLSRADLSRADLSRADLSRTDLSGANLSGANLSGADLSRADLYDANLSRAINADYVIAQTRILPEGDLIGWKKCNGGVIVKLRIPEAAKRSHAFGRKCRAEYVDVIEIIGGDKAISQHDGKTEYIVGARVVPDSFSDDWQSECSNGIHFFITKIEAENY